MLHVRDCPGTTASFDVCPFPWCRKVKHLLYHLVSCTEGENCNICSGTLLPKSMLLLQCLNEHRGEKYQKALVAKAKSAAETNNGNSNNNSSGSKPRAAAHSKASKPRAAAAAIPAPNALAPKLDFSDTAVNESSNSLAALAAAAEALASEDFAADICAPDDAMSDSAAASPLQICLPAASNHAEQTAVASMTSSTTATEPTPTTAPAAATATTNDATAKAPATETPALGLGVVLPADPTIIIKTEMDPVTTEPATEQPVVPPIKTEEITEPVSAVPTVKSELPGVPLATQTSSTTATLKGVEEDDKTEPPPSAQLDITVDEGAVPIDNGTSQTPSADNKPPAEPLRVL